MKTTPPDADATSSEEQGMMRLLACDVFLDTEAIGPGGAPSGSAPATEEDERGRGRLLLLLRMLDAADAMSEAPGGGAAEARRRDEAPGASPALLDRFEIIEEVGAGGFGFVVRARDRLLGREVALKMPVPERLLATKDVGRFLREARAAARLDHPGIVRVFDAGELGPLGYFIASEFCDGPSLRRWLKSQPAPVPPRMAARWAEKLADAVQHAHDRGILHRDIKPDNVILAPGQTPLVLVPRLTDFGLAKLVEEAGEDSASGSRVGTLRYMAPEQAAGRRGEVGPAADIYAMGATLYEILTGRPPFHGETEAETLHLVLESEPVSPRTLRPGLPRDLETICLKCLRKEPGRRYGTAAGLRDDLRRYLDGRPIVGRPVSLADRAWGWARRRPGVAALVGLVIALAAGLAGGVAWWVTWLEWHNRQLRIHVERADHSAQVAESQSRIAEERRRLANRHHYAEGLRRARQALDARQVDLAQDILGDLEPDPGEADPRGFAWRYLHRKAHGEFSRAGGHEASVQGWAWSRDGRSLLTWDLHRKVVLWDVTPGPGLARPRGVPTDPRLDAATLRFAPDGRTLAGVERGPSGLKIRLIDPASGDRIGPIGAPSPGGNSLVQFDRERRRLAVIHVAREGPSALWSWDFTEPSATPQGRSLGRDRVVHCDVATAAPFLVVDRDGRIVVLEPWSGAVVRELRFPSANPAIHVGYSADGRLMAVGSDDRLVVWDVASWREEGSYRLEGGLGRIRFGPRGDRLAVMDASGYVTVLDRSPSRRRLLTSGERRSLYGHSMSFSGDGALLAVAVEKVSGGPQPPEVWDVEGERRVGVFPGRVEVCGVEFFPGDRSAVLTGGIGPRIWRIGQVAGPDGLEGHADEAWAAAFSPDGKVLATGSDDTHEPRTIKLWDAATGRRLAGWKGHSATVAALAFGPGGRLLATAGLDSGGSDHPNVLLWDVATHRRLASLDGHVGAVRGVAFSPDGRTLATCGEDATARLWDVASRSSRLVLAGHTQRLMSLAFSPDGSTLATASNDATVRTWDVATGRPRAVFRDADEVRAVAFAPSGSLLATANLSGSITLRDLSTGDVIRTIRGAADQVRCLAFTPEGRTIAAAGKGKVIRIWDVATGQELLALEGHEAQVNALAFSPDGSSLASCSHDGAVRLWRASPIEASPGW